MIRIEVQTIQHPTVSKWHVRAAARWIDPKDLEGIEVIRIVEDCPFDTHSKQYAPYLRGFLYNGHYSSGGKNGAHSEIVLYRRDIHFAIPKILLFTPVATLKVARHLAHEVGHHVIEKRPHRKRKYKPIANGRHRDSEDKAWQYARNVLTKMLQHPVYRVAYGLNKAVAKVLFNCGIEDYWDGKYQSSAQFLFRSSVMNPDNREEASQAYRHAMEKLRRQEPSPLSTEEQDWLQNYYNPYPMTSGRLKRNKRDRLASVQR